MTGAAGVTGEVNFFARMAAGAHRNTGSSLALSGTPNSMGNVQIQKPSAGAGTPDLAVTKTGPSNTSPGQVITYTLNYQNKSTATNTATGVQLSDMLPTGLTYVTNSCSGTCSVTGNTITWDLGSLTPGASGSRTYQATVGTSAFTNGQTFTNGAQINSSQDDANFNDNTSSVTTTVFVPAISGSVINDANGNGVVNLGEGGLAGAQVSLFLDNGNGLFGAGDTQVGSTITTDATGAFTFTTGVVKNATYFVVRTNPSGFTSTAAFAGSGTNSTASVVSSDQIKVTLQNNNNTFSSNNNFLANGTHNTSTAVSCTANPVTYGGTTTCTATVTDTSTGPTAPGGTVTFGNGGASGSFGSTTCTLSGGSSPTSCSVTYTPGAFGTGSQTISASYGGDSTHSTSSNTTTLNINKAALTITAQDESKTYGATFTPNGTTQFTTSGLVNTDSVTSVTLTSPGYAATATVVGSPYLITPSAAVGSGLGNYNITYALGSFTVNQKAATVTADDKSKTYGDDNPTLTATVSGTVNGDTLNYTLATTAVKFSNVGTYPITVTLGSNPNYSVTKTDGTLTISPKTANVSADPKSKTYGDDNPTLTATVTGTVNGDTLNYTLATTAVKFSNVGSYPITVTLGVNSNYTVSKTDSTLTINQKAASVAADPKSKTYGDDNPTLTATVTGTVNGDTLNYTLATTAVKFSGVGSYPITVTLGSNPNYSVTKTDSTLTINQKAASVAADPKSKTYGDDNPTLTATVTGTVNGDVLNYTLATTAVKFSNVGTYPITVTLGSNPNYTVTKTDGTLTISQKAATVTADDKSKTYGDDNPTLTATVTGEVSGGDPVNYTLATTAVKFSNVGTYPITVTLGSNPNYSVTKTDGTLTISPKTANVSADPKSKTYGDDNPSLTATVTGTVNGDTLNYTLATTAVKFSNVGSYPITVTLGVELQLHREQDRQHADDQPEGGQRRCRSEVEDLRRRQPDPDRDGHGHGQRRHAQLHAGHHGGEVLRRRQLPDHRHPGLQPQLLGDQDRQHADD